MSRRTRPLRRVRGADRDRLREASAAKVAVWAWAGPPFPPLWKRWPCRPSQLRRCLLGLPVSARAAAKILAAACGPNIRREPGNR